VKEDLFFLRMCWCPRLRVFPLVFKSIHPPLFFSRFLSICKSEGLPVSFPLISKVTLFFPRPPINDTIFFFGTKNGSQSLFFPVFFKPKILAGVCAVYFNSFPQVTPPSLRFKTRLFLPLRSFPPGYAVRLPLATLSLPFREDHSFLKRLSSFFLHDFPKKDFFPPFRGFLPFR